MKRWLKPSWSCLEREPRRRSSASIGQKLIRIADRSDLGWNVVSEYTADELADDSEEVVKVKVVRICLNVGMR